MIEDAISERGHQFFRLMESELASGELNFPTCMELGLRIRRALDAPDTGVEELARIISVEPLLAAHVVRLANSAMYRRGGKAASDVRTASFELMFVMTTVSAAFSILEKHEGCQEWIGGGHYVTASASPSCSDRQPGPATGSGI